MMHTGVTVVATLPVLPGRVFAAAEPTHAGVAVIAQDSGRVLMLQRTWDETDDEDVRGTWEWPGGGRECLLCGAAFAVERSAADEAATTASVDHSRLGGVRVPGVALSLPGVHSGRPDAKEDVVTSGLGAEVTEPQAGAVLASTDAVDGVALMVNDMAVRNGPVNRKVESAMEVLDLAAKVGATVARGSSRAAIQEAVAARVDASRHSGGEQAKGLDVVHAASVPPVVTQDHEHEWESPEQTAWREWQEETGLPVPDGETVNGWRSADGVYQGFVFLVPVETEAFPEINPDAAAADTENPDDPDRRNPDVTAWFTLDQVQNLGPALRPVINEMDWSVFDLQEDDDMADDIIEIDEPEVAAVDDIGPVPWFGILTVEGLPSGDKRMFREGSLRSRPLPLPLTWQKTSASGHDGNVTVAMIEKVWRAGNFVWGSGHFLQTVEADEVMALIASFGRYGVSIDADDLDEFAVEVHDDGLVEFTDARHCSACIVSIPAFAEAQVAIGEYSDEFAGGWGAPSQPIPNMDEVEEECENIDPETGECLDEVEEVEEPDFALTAAAGTEDGPGWLTNPVDTDRLRDYWVRGEGAAKIAWGTPGDFNRCRLNLAKYVKPQYLSGYCANRHKDALGIWPGEHLAGEAMTASAAVEISEVEVAPYLVAAGPKKGLPLAWFQNPGLEGPTALTVTEDGQIFGHLAIFGTCHIGFDGVCTDVPKSATDYAYFRTGMVRTADGDVYTGNISMGGGHAGHGLKWRAAAEHYDSTSSVIADVACGDDEHGVWVAGAVRAGVTDEQIAELLASGGLSGDWREVRRGSNELELVAALAVNVGGFPVPRMQIAASGGHVTALVAAGVITQDDDPVTDLVDAVVARLDARAESIAATARLDALRDKEAQKRLAALRARA